MIRYACIDCGRVSAGRYCATHRRPTTTSARGYGTKHQKQRNELLAKAYGQPCPLCGEVMTADDALDLDHEHGDPQHTTGNRITHASCNRRRSHSLETQPPPPDVHNVGHARPNSEEVFAA